MKNFQFKISLILFAIFTMTACQKESMEELKNSEVELTTTEKPDPRTMIPGEGDIIRIPLDRITSGVANSRSATTLIYHGTFEVAHEGWKYFSYLKQLLPDPSIYKLEIEIRPLNGDPDLYFHAHNWNNGQKRFVRSSLNFGTSLDKDSFRKTGLSYQEEEMCVGVYGYTNTKFEITVLRTTIDCQEYPTADQNILANLDPVCGCDGQEYINPSSAITAGITSYTLGACPVVFLPDGDYYTPAPHQVDDFYKMEISNNQQVISVGTYMGQTVSENPDEEPYETDAWINWGETELSYNGETYLAVYVRGDITYTLEISSSSLDEPIKMEVTTYYPEEDRPSEIKIYEFYEPL